jgi:hypothetical protein
MTHPRPACRETPGGFISHYGSRPLIDRVFSTTKQSLSACAPSRTLRKQSREALFPCLRSILYRLQHPRLAQNTSPGPIRVKLTSTKARSKSHENHQLFPKILRRINVRISPYDPFPPLSPPSFHFKL